MMFRTADEFCHSCCFIHKAVQKKKKKSILQNASLGVERPSSLFSGQACIFLVADMRGSSFLLLGLDVR